MGGDACAFADQHFVLALAGAGRREVAARMVGSIAARAGTEADTQARLHGAIGLAASRAVAAAMDGAPAVAVHDCDAAMPELVSPGGSHAQRSVFVAMRERAALDAQAGVTQRREEARLGAHRRGRA